ncbi:pyrroloquinoline quinone biosynthesis peptide chaperone PqqD [Kribbella sp. CA-293567]|uniref:pyrroloquinoline quinone biosynthesis peptide chaperone PqqD n=1 Tax=Kribbella sp. CA-293567 TaxID=3002436 RepID=UPI0022DDE50B|nr:pyrroloquinoline quinone biosynthesis peptide chaperone PqqD [Kribbella sp. CA-293567]WBQ04722.1 pyrroloquinoline quinone biosynthesis peptide chaperone PqqD [Kribbella sp. CA-293567]
MTAPATRPRLKRGVRLTYDHTRDLQVLLYPEGVLVPNPTATAILRLCDGNSTLDEITVALSKQYAEVQPQQVADVLARLAERQVVEWS